MGACIRLRLPVRPLGNRFKRLSTADSCLYLEQINEAYRHYARTGMSGRVCEIGPGNTYAPAVLFAREGATQIHFVDRFDFVPGPEDEPIRRQLFAQNQARLAESRLTLPAIMARVHCHHGLPVEQFFARSDTGTFDFIGSNAVLEHVSDPLGALDQMYAALNPGGVMVHLVDLRCHRLFRRIGPLEWLKIPARWHARLIRHSALPNRILCHEYQNWARRCGTAEVHLRKWIGNETYSSDTHGRPPPPELLANATALIDAQRHEFAAGFQSVPTEQLAVAVIALVARKPA